MIYPKSSPSGLSSPLMAVVIKSIYLPAQFFQFSQHGKLLQRARSLQNVSKNYNLSLVLCALTENSVFNCSRNHLFLFLIIDIFMNFLSVLLFQSPIFTSLDFAYMILIFVKVNIFSSKKHDKREVENYISQ